VLDAGQRKRKSSKKPRRRANRRSGRRQWRYKTTAEAANYRLLGRKRRKRSLRELFERQRKQRNRRSRARLGRYESATRAIEADRVGEAARSARGAVQISFRAVVNVLVLGSLGWLLIWFFASDRFYVNQIVVQGNERVSTEAIVAASAVRGYSVFWIDKAAIADAVTSALPPIKQVEVGYGLPNQLTLSVVEQGEQIMWLALGQHYWVDEAGHFHPAQAGTRPQLLVRDIRPGVHNQVDPEAVRAAHQLVNLMPDLEVVDYAPPEGLRFEHELGWTVYLGVGDDMPDKIRVMHAIEDRFEAEGVRQPYLVDLRYPDSPYCRYPDA
jgi:cell division septal protein FtsQ